MLQYKVEVGQFKLTLKRSFPFKNKLIVNPEDICEIYIELLMSRPITATIRCSKLTRITEINLVNFKAIKKIR